MYKKGFSLIEILMVVVIIGILVTVAVPSYTRTIERAKMGQAKSDLNNMRKAQLEWFTENQAFTQNLGDLEGTIGGNFHNTDDWTYTIPAIDNAALTFSLQAARQSGAESGQNIFLDQDEVFTSSNTYLADYGMD
ncbi:MAG: type IV pilin protein [Candidatus Omnitrophota bacterium]